MKGSLQTLQNTNIAPTLKMNKEENLRNYRLVDETLNFVWIPVDIFLMKNNACMREKIAQEQKLWQIFTRIVKQCHLNFSLVTGPPPHFILKKTTTSWQKFAIDNLLINYTQNFAI